MISKTKIFAVVKADLSAQGINLTQRKKMIYKRQKNLFPCAVGLDKTL